MEKQREWRTSVQRKLLFSIGPDVISGKFLKLLTARCNRLAED